MTWQHLQQLRATAQAALRQQVGQAQPQGGNGAIVQGSSIALLADRTGPARRQPARWTLVIFATIDYEHSGVDSSGDRHFDTGHFPRDAAAIASRFALPFPPQMSYALEKSQFFETTPDEQTGAWIRRSSTVKFEAMAVPGQWLMPDGFSYEQCYYRIPVEITVGHRLVTMGKYPEITSTRKLRLGRSGAEYTPKTDKTNEFYELTILEIRRA